MTSVKREQSRYGTYLKPGFIDAHCHIKSSMLCASEFARLAVVHGAVAIMLDPHEIVSVLGREGANYMIENGILVTLPADALMSHDDEYKVAEKYAFLDRRAKESG
ncbi:MAG: amidohydrolase family protein [Syntrophales bacterium]|nr:amidohydrolase family protein [Syntrophales bacterium]